jgi:hypothetical protein
VSKLLLGLAVGLSTGVPPLCVTENAPANSLSHLADWYKLEARDAAMYAQATVKSCASCGDMDLTRHFFSVLD